MEQSIPPQELKPSTPKPEIIANPALPNTRLLISTPVYNEWKNGGLVRSVTAALSQKLPQGISIETNYVLNNGGYQNFLFDQDNRDNNRPIFNPKLAEEYPSAIEALGQTAESARFLKDVVEVQRLARLVALEKGNVLHRAQIKIYQDQIAYIMSTNNDPRIIATLRLAQEKADQVSVSAVDASKILLPSIGYSMGDNISNLRTVGMDFASERLQDPQAVFLMNDTDTVPALNNFANDLLDIYKNNPQIMYLFLGLSYLPPGANKDIVADSPHYSSSRIVGYNRYAGGSSPQISFRRSAFETMQAIVTGNSGYEDYETGRRLMTFYGDLQKGALFHQAAIQLPTQLTSDREGFVDGANRMENLLKTGVASMMPALHAARDTIQKMQDQIHSLEPTVAQRIENELTTVHTGYTKDQKVLLRFNRSVATAFLNEVAKGNIKIENGSLQVNAERVAEGTFGKALIEYINTNKDTIASLTPHDLALIHYYVTPQAPFPEGITELSPFQLAMREYLGDYREFPPGAIEDILNLADSRGIQDRTTVLQPFIAEMLAQGTINSQYLLFDNYVATNSHAKHREVEISTPLDERVGWVKNSLAHATPLKRVGTTEALKTFLSQCFPICK